MGGPGSGRRKRVESKDPAPKVKVTSSTRVKQYKVTSPAGAEIILQGAAEKTFYEQTAKSYLEQNEFTAATDLADLALVVFLETMQFRWQNWLGSGQNYDKEWLSKGEEEQYRRNIQDYSRAILEAKSKLGLTRDVRMADQENVAEYLTNLRRRALLFKKLRDEQIVKALVLFKELQSIVRTWRRSNEQERRVVGIETEADIVKWLEETAFPQFDEIDAHFRATEQSKWAGAPERD